jgi:putative ABC transport system substrate-binding protein
MLRREFLALFGGAATFPFAAAAQQKAVIGFFGVHSPKTLAPGLLPAFWRGLNEVGYHEERNVAVDYLWADGRYERLPALAAELVRRRVDVIVAAGGSIAAQTAKDATSTIPVIILAGDDPVRLGLVNSINQPGGNLTGVAQLVVASEGKRLELLRELVPTADVIAFLSNPARSNSERQVTEIQNAAGALGLKLLVVEADEDDDLAPAFARARAEAGALVVGADPYFFVRHDSLVALAAVHALPTMYFFREFVLAGGLVSYGSNLASAFHQVGVYTGKVLKGTPPAELPLVQQSDKLELVLNVKTAKTLGLSVPPTLLARADEVIE